jgi:predicted DNA binding CopG/RHH family protein
MQKLKRSGKVPRFRSEAAERAYWETHDTAGYVDWSKARPAAFPNLRPSTETISLRLPAGLLGELKTLANKRDVPYQSLLRVFLAERVAQERANEQAATVEQPRPLQSARASAPALPKRSRDEVLRDLNEFGKGRSLGGLTIRQLINEGRRF